MLLDDYKKAKDDYYKKQKELEKILTPLKAKMYKLESRVEKYIITHKVYLPISELKKYSGCAEDITVVYKEDKETKLNEWDFAGYIIEDGVLVFDSDNMNLEEVQYTHKKDNIYELYGDYGYMNTVELLGFYDLNTGDGIIPETSLEYLWKKD